MPHPPQEATQRKEAQGFSLRSKDSSPTLGTPALGPGTRKVTPLPGLQVSRAYRRDVGNRDPSLKACMLLLPSPSVKAADYNVPAVLASLQRDELNALPGLHQAVAPAFC